ncbi:MAG: hypothetical protein HQL41_15645 [Alphaproteobacteria bacterium]|nr:hypothetical protein [Alphaproteobacteria bacterium]
MRLPATTSFDSDPRAALDGVHDAVRRADVTITEDEIEAEIEACRRERAAALRS